MKIACIQHDDAVMVSNILPKKIKPIFLFLVIYVMISVILIFNGRDLRNLNQFWEEIFKKYIKIVFKEFLVLENGQAVANFQQACRFPGATIIGVHWLSDRQVALVAEAGCEFYAVNANRRTLKLIKQTAMPINWFNFYVWMDIGQWELSLFISTYSV